MSGDASRARPPAWRILIAGAGIPGLALGVALVRHLGGAVEVTLVDPAAERRRPDPRAYALSAASRDLLATLGIWDELAASAQPISRMTITDSRLADAVRPDYLRFGDDGEPLGHMVEAEVLQRALAAAADRCGLAVLRHAVTDLAADAVRISSGLDGGDRHHGHLVVAVDGARSRLRDLAGIAWFGRGYPQAGIVATVSHTGDHHGRAVQHFLPAGPFAILPLVPRDGRWRSSIVWTERRERVDAIMALSREEVLAEVETRFGAELGDVRLETDLASHPLSVGLARSFVAPRFALLGDAAHQIHPLAGQGLNLALGDVAALARRIVEAVRLGLDPGGPDILSDYQRDRRFDAVALAAATDGLNRLFSNDVLPARVLRDIGLGLVDRAPRLKGFFAGQAGGQAGGKPGEAL